MSVRDISLEDTFFAYFSTRAFASGIPTVLAGTPVVSAYENDSVTQITAGITLGVSHDSVVGLNLLTVVATAANGYEAGKDYALVITTGTVDSVSVVGEVVAEFTIGRSAAAVDLANATDGLGALKALIDTVDNLLDTEIPAITAAVITNAAGVDIAADIIAAKASIDGITAAVITNAAGADIAADIIAMKAETVLIVGDTNELQTDWADGGRLDLLLDALATAADLLDKLGAVDETAADGDPSSTESVMQYIKQLVNILVGTAGVVTFPAGAAPGNAVSLAEIIRAIYDDTDVIGATGAGLTSLATAAELAKVPKSDGTVTWNATAAAQIQTEAADALTAYDAPTRAELTSDINSVLARLRGLVLVEGTIGATGNDSTHLHLDGLTYGDDEINGYILVVFDTSGSEYHVEPITDWVLSSELATVATLPFTPEASTDTYWLLSAQAGSGSAPTAAEVADAVWDEAQSAHTTAGTFGEVATEVALILLDSDELQTDDYPTSIAAVQTAVDAVNTDLSNATDGLSALKALIDAVQAAVDALNDITAASILTTQITESYAADGVAPTVAQALMLTLQRVTEFSVSGTSLTVKKLDGSTTAAVLTLDSSSAPTSSTRSS